MGFLQCDSLGNLNALPRTREIQPELFHVNIDQSADVYMSVSMSYFKWLPRTRHHRTVYITTSINKLPISREHNSFFVEEARARRERHLSTQEVGGISLDRSVQAVILSLEAYGSEELAVGFPLR